MSKRKYLPLRVCDLSIDRDGIGGVPEMLYTNKIIPEIPMLEDYTNFVFGKSFGDPVYNGKYKGLNDFILNPKTKDVLYERWGILHTFDYITEQRDIFGCSAVITLWSRCKIVYKLDDVFFDELSRTENISFWGKTFSSLPFQTFYIDLEDCVNVRPICGAFVHVLDTGTGNQIVVYMVTNEEEIFSFYSKFSYDENGIYNFEGQIPNTPFIATDFSVGAPYETKRKSLVNDRRNDVLTAIIQTLMFISSEKPDVEEDLATINSYKPSFKIRNKYSEIRRWNVGVRYGTAIKFSKQEIKKISMSYKVNELISERKPPRPHVRCAHWQRYHVGKGKKKTVLRWIPPTFVCGNQELPVTIHRFSN